MRKPTLVIIFILFFGVAYCQNQKSDNCIALDIVIKTGLFKNTFGFCLPDRRDSMFHIVDTGNYFNGFTHKAICSRSIEINNYWTNVKSVNTIVAYRTYIVPKYFILHFFCPMTGRHCDFILGRKRSKNGVNKWKIVGTYSGSL